ncbi:MAG: hypothetical protein HY903_07350 [Deltaproteobacteria bacterium]|nr:hypothetical protein [Deltaproteobacteria bacterium]
MANVQPVFGSVFGFRHLVVLVGCVVVVGGSGGARAEESVGVSQLEVSLWPEYDRAAMLVIYRARLPSDLRLPTVVTLPIPAGVGAPHAVARRAADGVLLVADYTREVVGDTAWVRIATDTPEVQLEYYGELAKNGDRRSYTYVWPGGVAVEILSYEIQSPRGATEITVLPAATRQADGEDGRTYYFGSLGRVAKADVAKVELNYRRASDDLGAAPALDAAVAATTARPSVPATSDAETNDRWVWAVLALAAVLFGASVVVFAQSGRRPKA